MRNQAYGQRLLAALRELFGVIHRRDQLSVKRFAVELPNAGDELLAQSGMARAQHEGKHASPSPPAISLPPERNSFGFFGGGQKIT